MSIIDGMAPQVRRYRILAVVAEGGYGRVYRARLEGTDGFTKDVAIKLMRPGTPDAEMSRFRDEIRILGLARDRAIVSVEPPMWLDGRPALVMDYADGASAARLLQQLGAFPATVVLEIVEEVARALDVVYQQAGPDGRPLQIVHRDLKPGNLQISSSGALRILDFGIASAEFNRECSPDGRVFGTAAYIAPERFTGIEGPQADIYSLGVLLRTLVTGESPDPVGQVRAQNRDNLPPEVTEVLRVADLLADPLPEHRPQARRVEDLCRELRIRLEGPTLRQWATLNVFTPQSTETDALIGKTLTESRRDPNPRSWLRWTAGVAGAAGSVVMAAFLVGAAISSREQDRPVLAGIAAVPSHQVTFATNVPGASVTIDGIASGSTPLDTALPEGAHVVRIVTADAEIERQIHVSAAGPRRYMWDGGEAWKVLY